MKMYGYIRKVSGPGFDTPEVGSIALDERPFIGEEVLLDGEYVKIESIRHDPEAGLVLVLKEKQDLTAWGTKRL